MKLYYSPGACSLSPHIALREAGAKFDLVKVDLKTHKLASGGDYTQVNAKGYVPALETDAGQVLTEGPAIVQYIADQRPESGLAPKAGTMERYRLMEWLNFITSELHKSHSPLFNPASSEDWKKSARASITTRYDWVDKTLGGGPYLMGATFTVADCYLFTVLSWGKWVDIDIARWPNLKAYVDRVSARPAVHAALVAEGLAK